MNLSETILNQFFSNKQNNTLDIPNQAKNLCSLIKLSHQDLSIKNNIKIKTKKW